MKIQVRIVIALVFLSAFATCVSASDIWYEDNNLGKAGGMPTDFIKKFRYLESFRKASRYIRVYMVRSSVLGRMEDRFLAGEFAPYLEKNRLKLAIDAVGATWARKHGREKVAAEEIELLKRLRRLGLQVDYISLQSVLSKPLISEGRKLDYPLRIRIEDVVFYSKAVRDIYPLTAIGIIDALPSHGKEYRAPYRLLRDALAREKIRLSYIHLDMPFELIKERRHGVTWQKVLEIESYVEDELGSKFGFIATSRTGGYTSSKAYHDRVMAALECYLGLTAGSPHDFIIASWFPHPARTIPETAVADDYPAMRTVLDFGRKLEKIEKAGPSWRYQRVTGWRAMCNA